MYGLIGKMRAASGRRDELIGILVEATGAMPGCLNYIVARDPGDKDAVWITEVWSDEAASDAALNRDLGEAGLGSVLGLLAGPPEFIELSPMGGPGLS